MYLCIIYVFIKIHVNVKKVKEDKSVYNEICLSVTSGFSLLPCV